MKRQFLLVVSFALVVPVSAQPASSRTNNPARRDTGPLPSPEVHTNSTVTFRLRAPGAQEVKITGEWASTPTAMTNNDGVWSTTIGPLEPDVYGYSFNVDGLIVVDPGNPAVKPMRAARTSILQVKGEPARLWDLQSVPHGTVHEHIYASKSLGIVRRLHVYTPPGYEKGTESFPVLYLFHGSGDTDATWTEMGKAHLIADNLVAAHKCKPMLVVMPDGHAFTGNPSQVTADLISRNVQAFGDDLLKDVVPLVEATYRTKADRDQRAIIGLSMGGGQSLNVGLKNRKTFAWVGAMSAYLPDASRTVTETFAERTSELKLLWFACGKDDRLIDNARELSQALKDKGIAHQFKETPGNHSWPVWRRYLGEFLPLLFTDNAAGK